MPFGAHESMELHEILMEKINIITHFNLYAKQVRHPQLLDMILRHQQEEIRSYNEIVAFTRGNSRFAPISPNTDIGGISNQQIQYGINNPPQFAPQADATLDDSEIAVAMLLCHKNAARNGHWAALECADPNLRRTLMNSAASCTNQAYEVFLFMNEQGLYQVPALNNQGEAFLRRYQPASRSLEQQYAMQGRQNQGYAGGASAYGNQMYPGANMTTSGNNATDGSLYVGARDSVLYGSGGSGGSSFPYQAGAQAMYGDMNQQGMMPQ
jgi:spore coat protein CotF